MFLSKRILALLHKVDAIEARLQSEDSIKNRRLVLVGRDNPVKKEIE